MVRVRLGDLLSAGAARLLLALALAGAPTLARQAAAQATDSAPAILVIARDDGVAPDSLSTAELRRVFMLRRRFWPGGGRIAPVNLPATDPLRERFSRTVLGRSPRQLVDYWNDLYFHGVEPPPVVESQQAVQLYVARTPGAIGYVEEGALDPTIQGLRILRVLR